VKLLAVPVIKSAASFKEWFAHNPANEYVEKLELRELSTQPGTYQFSSSDGRTVNDDLRDIFLASDAVGKNAVTGGATTLKSGFFPKILEANSHPKVCNLWPYWNANPSCTGKQWYSAASNGAGAEIANVKGEMRNFYFTSEARYLFRFAGNEKLAFYGDDDVWVYINGRLVLDMGAPHERLEGTVELSATGALATLASNGAKVGAQQTVAHGMEPGKTYEIAIFHADRHPRESNYQLTLTGFSRSNSRCTPECGNGIVTAGEECDDGPENADGKYDGCSKTTCSWNSFCGDGVPDPEEECDLGREKNVSRYGEKSGCTPTCKRPAFCGDGKVDSPDEPCDPAAPGAASGCSSECHVVIP
jgi:fibro-slime domain-containing protein